MSSVIPVSPCPAGGFFLQPIPSASTTLRVFLTNTDPVWEEMISNALLLPGHRVLGTLGIAAALPFLQHGLAKLFIFHMSQ